MILNEFIIIFRREFVIIENYMLHLLAPQETYIINFQVKTTKFQVDHLKTDFLTRNVFRWPPQTDRFSTKSQVIALDNSLGTSPWWVGVQNIRLSNVSRNNQLTQTS